MSRRVLLTVCFALLALGVSAMLVDAQGPKPSLPNPRAPTANVGTAFTYQGQLKRNGALANSTCNLQFGLWDASTLGNQVGLTVTISPVAVTNGLFTTPVDFGANVFNGNARWLQTQVQCAGDVTYTTLNPRQALTPAPMAFALPGFYTTQNITSPNVIGGNGWNTVDNGIYAATISGGGLSNNIYNNHVSANFGTIGGGLGNTTSGSYATIGGGSLNTAVGEGATISGGADNLTNNGWATIVGGLNNVATGRSSVVGGENDVATGQFSVVMGGYNNTAQADYSFAAGRKALARNTGSFVWNDSVDSGAPFADSQANEFNVRSSGGVRLFTSDNYNTYCILPAGSGSWNCTSDRNAKANFAPTNGQEILARLAALPIETWNYKSQDASIRHIGPMAQDFHTAFNVGEDDKTISTVDAQGVTFAAIQGLYQENQELEAKSTKQQAVINELHQQNAALDARITTLEQAIKASGMPAYAYAGSIPTTWVLFGGLIVAGWAMVRKRE